MTTAKRTIAGQRYNVAELVDSAISAADSRALNTDAARTALARMGHSSPADALVIRYARESAILAELAHTTGAAFTGQIGKIAFDNRDKAISQVNAYLNRRIAGQRANWSRK